MRHKTGRTETASLAPSAVPLSLLRSRESSVYAAAGAAG